MTKNKKNRQGNKDAELPEGEGVEDPDLEEVGNGSSGDPVEEEGPFELDEEEPTL